MQIDQPIITTDQSQPNLNLIHPMPAESISDNPKNTAPQNDEARETEKKPRPSIHHAMVKVTSKDPKLTATFMLNHLGATMEGGKEFLDSSPWANSHIRVNLANLDIQLICPMTMVNREVGVIAVVCRSRTEWDEWDEYVRSISPNLYCVSRHENGEGLYCNSLWDMPGDVRLAISWNAGTGH